MGQKWKGVAVFSAGSRRRKSKKSTGKKSQSKGKERRGRRQPKRGSGRRNRRKSRLGCWDGPGSVEESQNEDGVQARKRRSQEYQER